MSSLNRVISVAVLAILVTAPVLAQHNHGNVSRSNKANQTPQYSQNQMMNMLDQVETGKAPRLPARSAAPQGAHQSQMRSMIGAGRSAPMMGHGMYSGMGRAPAPPMMGHGMMGHGMGSMRSMGGGSALGMLQRGVGSPKASQFMQKLKQKLSTMQGGAAGGAAGQNQFLQQMMQRGSAQGAMGRAPTGQFGMPGASMGMAPMMPSKAPMQSLGSMIKRPSAITGGAGSPMGAFGGKVPATSGGNMSELERQMEQQYGH